MRLDLPGQGTGRAEEGAEFASTSGLEVIYRIGFVAGGLSLLIFFLAHFGLLSAPFIIVPAVTSAGLAAWFAYRAVVNAQGRPAPRWTLPEKLLAAACVLAALSVLPLAVTPPTVRDELIQHLALPKMYLEAGSAYEVPFMGFSYLPHNIDLLYLVPLAFGCDTVPRLIHLGFASLTGLLIYFFMLHRAGRSTALLGAFLYLATPLVMNLSRMAYVDLADAFYSALALFALVRWSEEGFPSRWLVYAGVSMGLALGVKYNTVHAFVLLTAFVLYVHVKRGAGPAGAVKNAALFVAITLAVLSPWLVRSYLWTGSPVYPLYKVAVTAVSSGEGVHITGGLSPLAKRLLLYGEGVLDVILVPLRIFWEGRDNSLERFDGVLNPVFLVLIPMAFVRMPGALRWGLLAFSVLFFYMTFFTVDLVTRYLLPAFVPCVVLAAFGAGNMLRFRWARPVLWGLLAIFVIISGLYLRDLYSVYRPWDFISGEETREEYLARILPDYGAVREANSVLPYDSRVLLLFAGDRVYYWEREVVYSDRLGNNLLVMVKTSDDAEELAGRLTAGNVTHLFVKDSIFERFANDNFTAEELRMLTRFFESRTRRVVSDRGFSVYELR